jgi:hypothetical protein
LLGKMAHDRLIGIRTVFGRIGVGEALEGVPVAGFDSVKPSLLDKEAQAGMIEPNQGTDAGEIKTAWVKWGTWGLAGQGNSLGCVLYVLDQAGNPGCVSGQDALAGMRVQCCRHSRRDNYWGG